jgi:hypothetical protein
MEINFAIIDEQMVLEFNEYEDEGYCSGRGESEDDELEQGEENGDEDADDVFDNEDGQGENEHIVVVFIEDWDIEIDWLMIKGGITPLLGVFKVQLSMNNEFVQYHLYVKFEV